MGEQELKESGIIYILTPGAKNYKLLVKRDNQTVNGQFFFYNIQFIYNAHNYIQFILQA